MKTVTENKVACAGSIGSSCLKNDTVNSIPANKYGNAEQNRHDNGNLSIKPDCRSNLKGSRCRSCAFLHRASDQFALGMAPKLCVAECLMERAEFGSQGGCSGYIKRVKPEE